MASTLFHYYLGIDLGQAQDYTALSLIEEPLWVDSSWAWEVPVAEEQTGWVSPADLGPKEAVRALRLSNKRGRPPHPVLAVRGLERFKLGTPYPRIIERVQELIHSPPLAGKSVVGLVDKTGVGVAVLDSFRQAGLNPAGITIHGGDKVNQDPKAYGFRVPKRDLVSATQVLFQNNRLLISEGLEEAATLKKELQNFRQKINPETAHDTFSHWREGDHDDLVLSTAMACWCRQWYMRLIDEHWSREWEGER
jgi:hypothetical protein